MEIWKGTAAKLLILAAALLGVAILLLPPAASAAENIKAFYGDNCAGCHGASGEGNGPAAMALHPKPKPFSEALKGKSDAWIEKVIKGGGPAVGESPLMPSHADMSQAQLKEMVDYIKKL